MLNIFIKNKKLPKSQNKLSHNNTATKFPAGHLNLHLLAMPGVLLVPTVLGGLMLLWISLTTDHSTFAAISLFVGFPLVVTRNTVETTSASSSCRNLPVIIIAHLLGAVVLLVLAVVLYEQGTPYLVNYVLRAVATTGDLLFQLLLPLIAVMSAAAVALLRNPMHSLLALLSVFFSTVLFFVGAGVEYIGLTFLIVYVGAVAILFLFVIMLLNVKALTSVEALIQHVSQIAAIAAAVILFMQLQFEVVCLVADLFATGLTSFLPVEPTTTEFIAWYVRYGASDINSIVIVYSEAAMLFLTITGALLSALLGAIILATGTTERPTRIADLRPLRSSAIFIIVFAFHPDVALVFADLLSDFTFLVNTNTAADSCGVECMSIYDVYVLNEPKRPDQDLIVYEQADEVDQPGRWHNARRYSLPRKKVRKLRLVGYGLKSYNQRLRWLHPRSVYKINATFGRNLLLSTACTHVASVVAATTTEHQVSQKLWQSRPTKTLRTPYRTIRRFRNRLLTRLLRSGAVELGISRARFLRSRKARRAYRRVTKCGRSMVYHYERCEQRAIWHRRRWLWRPERGMYLLRSFVAFNKAIHRWTRFIFRFPEKFVRAGVRPDDVTWFTKVKTRWGAQKKRLAPGYTVDDVASPFSLRRLGPFSYVSFMLKTRFFPWLYYWLWSINCYAAIFPICLSLICILVVPLPWFTEDYTVAWAQLIKLHAEVAQKLAFILPKTSYLPWVLQEFIIVALLYPMAAFDVFMDNFLTVLGTAIIWTEFLVGYTTGRLVRLEDHEAAIIDARNEVQAFMEQAERDEALRVWKWHQENHPDRGRTDLSLLLFSLAVTKAEFQRRAQTNELTSLDVIYSHTIGHPDSQVGGLFAVWDRYLSFPHTYWHHAASYQSIPHPMVVLVFMLCMAAYYTTTLLLLIGWHYRYPKITCRGRLWYIFTIPFGLALSYTYIYSFWLFRGDKFVFHRSRGLYDSGWISVFGYAYDDMTSEIVVVYCLPLALIIFISALYRTRSVRLLQYQPRMAREFYNLDLRSINAPITHIREIAFEARLDESAGDNASPTPVSKDTCGTADSENSAPQKPVNVSKSK